MNHQQVHEIPKDAFRAGDHFVRGKYFRNGMSSLGTKRYNLEML